MGDSLYSELSSSHWVGLKWTPNAIIKFGVSYHELDIIDVDEITTFSNSFDINLKISPSSNISILGGHLYQSNKDLELPQSIAYCYMESIKLNS